jgi:hypothetical protein
MNSYVRFQKFEMKFYFNTGLESMHPESVQFPRQAAIRGAKG